MRRQESGVDRKAQPTSLLHDCLLACMLITKVGHIVFSKAGRLVLEQ